MDDKKAGIGWYCYNLIKQLIRLDNSNEYILIHRRKCNDVLYSICNELIIPYPKIIILKRTLGDNIQLPIKLDKYNFDIIHELSQIPPFLIKFDSIKIVTIHDLSALYYPETFGVFTVLSHRYILPHALKNTDVVITVSYNSKQDIVKLLGFPEDYIEVTYLGVDEIFKPINVEDDFLKKKYNLKEPYILYVGTLEPRKNVPTLLKAFYKLKRRWNIPHKLVIVGKVGWKYHSIFRVVEELELQKYVVFTGYVPREDLPKFYNSADIFVYPSIYEGFGLPPLEAMACGCPVVTTNVSSLPEVVGDAGIKVNPYDVGGLAKAIYDVITDEGLKTTLSKKGLSRAKKFSWEKTARKTLKIYKNNV